MRSSIRGVFLLLAFGALVGRPAPDTGSADDQPDMKLIEKGRAIWLTVAGTGCAGCHGRYGEGDVGIGPYNRGVGLSKIKAALDGVPQMRVLEGKLDDHDIEAVAAYNSWLGQFQLVKTLVKRDRFIPDAVDIYPGTAVQLAINNSGLSPRRFAGPSLEAGEFDVPGRDAYDFVWRAPQREGAYPLRCVDCLPPGQAFIINVSRGAQPYRGLADQDVKK